MVLDKLNVSNTFVNGEHYSGSSAVQGGALALSGNNCNITNSTFTNCSVVYYKDNSNASGGALYIWGNNTNIVNCNFTNNTASEDGGAIYIEGKDCTLNNTVFIGNVAHNQCRRLLLWKPFRRQFQGRYPCSKRKQYEFGKT